MALTASQIEVLFKARDQIGPVVQKVRAAVGRMQGSLRNAGQSLKNMGQRTIGASLSMATSIGGAAFAYQRFESAMNRVGAVSGATGEQLGRMTALAKELGSTTAFSAKEAADGMGFLAQAGFSVNETMEAMPGVLQLAAAGQVELGRAADIASNVLSGYGFQASEIGRVNDVLVKTFTSSNTSLEMLGDTFKYVAPLANASGLEFEEVAAAIGIMGDAGVQGSQAGTSLRGAMAKLLKPSEAAAEILAKLGVEVTDASGKMRPLAEIMEGLAPIANDTASMIEIFGQEAVGGMAPILQAGSERLREFTQDLRDSGGTAERVQKQQMAGLTGAWTNFKSAAEGVSIAVGDFMAPTLSKLLEIITSVAQYITKTVVPAFNRLDPTVKHIITGIGLFVAVLSPLLTGLGVLMTVTAPLLPILGTVAGLIGGTLVAAIGAVLTPVGLVLAAATALAAAWVLWGDEISKFVSNVWNAFLGKIGDGLISLSGLVEYVNSDLANSMVEWGAGLRATANEHAGLEGAVGTLKAEAELVGPVLKDVEESAADVGESAAEAAGPNGVGAMPPALSAVTGAADAADAAAKKAAKAFKELQKQGAAYLESAQIGVDTGTFDLRRSDQLHQLRTGMDKLLFGDNLKATALPITATLVGLPEVKQNFKNLAADMRGVEKERLADLAAANEEAAQEWRDIWFNAFQGLGGLIGALEQTLFKGLDGFIGGVQTKLAGAFGPQLGGLLGGLFSGGVATAVQMGLGVLQAGLGKLGGMLKRAFGGPSEMEVAGREAAGAWLDGLRSNLTTAQLQEAMDAGWADVDLAKSWIGMRDAALEAGLSIQEAEGYWRRMQDAIKEGPEAVERVRLEFEAATEAGLETAEAAEEAARRIEEAMDAAYSATQSAFESAKDAGEEAYDDIMEAAEAYQEAAANGNRKLMDKLIRDNGEWVTDVEAAEARAVAAKQKAMADILKAEGDKFVRIAAFEAALEAIRSGNAEGAADAAKRAAQETRKAWDTALDAVVAADEAANQAMMDNSDESTDHVQDNLDSITPPDEIEVPLKIDPPVAKVQNDINSIQGRGGDNPIILDFEQHVNPVVSDIAEYMNNRIAAIRGRTGGDAIALEFEIPNRELDRVYDRVLDLGKDGDEAFGQIRDAADHLGVSLAALHPALRATSLKEQVGNILEAFIELEKIGISSADAIAVMTDDAVMELGALIEAAARAGVEIPEHLQPIVDRMNELKAQEGIDATIDAMNELLGIETKEAPFQGWIDQMQELGFLTDEAAAAFSKMAGDAVVDIDAMEAAADKWGIKLEDLGTKYQQAKLSEQLLETASEFEALIESGLSVTDIIAHITSQQDDFDALKQQIEDTNDALAAAEEGSEEYRRLQDLARELQGDLEDIGETQLQAIQKLVTGALTMGQEIPKSMQPLLEGLLESGRLLDASGNKLESLDDIKFGTGLTPEMNILLEGFAAVITALGGDVPDAFKDMMGSGEDAAEGVDQAMDTATTNATGDFEELNTAVAGDADEMAGAMGDSAGDMQRSFQVATGAMRSAVGDFVSYVASNPSTHTTHHNDQTAGWSPPGNTSSTHTTHHVTTGDGFASGTRGFLDFGAGTPTTLHGYERVQTPGQAAAEIKRVVEEVQGGGGAGGGGGRPVQLVIDHHGKQVLGEIFAEEFAKSAHRRSII